MYILCTNRGKNVDSELEIINSFPDKAYTPHFGSHETYAQKVG
jgi:hypothetical protein